MVQLHANAIHSFLLIGQSNMAGRGKPEDALPVDGTHIRILRCGRWKKFFRPVNPDRSFSGVCLAESFAEAYAGSNGVTAGLIPCADGDTTLAQWQPGELLYDHAVAMAKLAMRTSQLTAILWHQGEANCAEHLTGPYEEELLYMLTQLRQDLGLPNVPVLLGGLGDFLPDCPLDPDLRFAVQINDALRRTADRLPHAAFVPAHGLTANADGLHFNSPSLHAFGLRYFSALTELQSRT